MSRWDALKSREQSSEQRNSRPVINSGLYGYFYGAGGNSSNRLVSSHSSTSHSYEELMSSLKNPQGDTDFNRAVVGLTSLPRHLLDKLPAESVARDLVDTILVQALSQTETHSRLEKSLFEAITTLLRVPSLCSALLSPLTVDVAQKTGKEERVANPIGKKLLSALESKLPQSCPTLTIFLDEVRKRSIADTLLVNFSHLYQYFVLHLVKTRAETLQLLRMVMITYPSQRFYNIFKALILTDHSYRQRKACNPSRPSCPSCQYQQTSSPLLDALHDGHYAATTCISLLLNAFPLEQWLSEDTKGSLKFFTDHLKNDLAQLLRTMQCRFSSLNDEFSMATAAVLMVIPCKNCNSNDALFKESMSLVSCLAHAIMKDPSCQPLVQCFCDCMGGLPQPVGGVTQTAKPLLVWLQLVHQNKTTAYDDATVVSAPSNAFQHYLIHNPLQNLQILCSILRVLPHFIPWEQLRLIMEECLASVKYRVDGMRLIESFVVGRCHEETGHVKFVYNEHNNVKEDFISQFLVQTLQNMLLDASAKVRTSSLETFCVLLVRDWSYAMSRNDELMERIMEKLTIISQQGSANDKSLAFKAMGDLLSKSLSVSSVQVPDERLQEICRTLLPILVDEGLQASNTASSTSSKAMVVFAIGNLALAIKDRASTHILLPITSILPLMDQVYECMCPSSANNDKIVGNAIRCMGHLAHVAFHEPYMVLLNRFDCIHRHGSIVTALTEKVKRAMGTSASQKSMTWKERSSAKRHGWGACHALGNLFDCSITLETMAVSREACVTLVECIEQYPTLSEKIVIAAIGALRLAPMELLANTISSCSGGTSLVGRCIACALLILSEDDVHHDHHRVKGPARLLLTQIVPILSVSDARTILETDGILLIHMEWLYEWMLSNSDLSAAAYEIVAMAFEQTHDCESNIALQQRFASRASWSYREGGSTTNATGDDDEL